MLFEPTSVQDFLNPPFVGHAFWVANRVVALALGDLYDFQINLIVTAQVAGSELRLEADVGSALGPVAADAQSMFGTALKPIADMGFSEANMATIFGSVGAGEDCAGIRASEKHHLFRYVRYVSGSKRLFHLEKLAGAPGS